MIPLYVLCSTEGSREAWRERAKFHCDLEVIPLHPVRSAIERIHELATRLEQPFLVCRDYIWVGLGMGRQVQHLIDELSSRFPNWAVCGNRGVRWDDQSIDFGRDIANVTLRTSLRAHTVISLDDNFLLIHPAVLRRHRWRAPAIPSLDCGVLLSLECLANGSVMAVSPRLMTLRCEPEGSEGNLQLGVSPEFRDYYRAHFLNHYFPSPAGGLDLREVVDFSYASEPLAEATQADILELYDRSLESATRKPSLTICCRTQFQRPEMLDRAVLSFTVCRDYASLLSDLQIRLVTDQPDSTAGPFLRRLEETYPAARLECWFHIPREARLSRIDLLRAAVERATTDYIWFVDDDDYVNSPALSALARCLVPDCPLVVIASSPVVNERWSEADRASSARKLLESEPLYVKSPRHLFEVLRGENAIPICGVVFPVELLRERLRNQAALGEYFEDYYLLLLMLTAARVEVATLETSLATISSRGRDNTVAQEDRSIWHQSYATFLLELLNNEEGNSPFLWQQANAAPWDWMEP